MTKEIKGKLIYQPTGPAGEYAKWAVNLHNGCTHGCTYCYNNRGVLSHAFGIEPKLARPIIVQAEKLKKERIKEHCQMILLIEPNLRFDAISHIIKSDIEKIGVDTLRKDGVFFSFKCDPLESDNEFYTTAAVLELLKEEVPVTLLTKSVGWLTDNKNWNDLFEYEKSAPLLTIGFTITGMDDMEVNAPSTAERIAALQKVHDMGIRTFVSMEPVIDITKAIDVFHDCLPYTNEFRVGLQSPYKKDRYTRMDIIRLISVMHPMQPLLPTVSVKFKDSVYRQCEAFGIKIR